MSNVSEHLPKGGQQWEYDWFEIYSMDTIALDAWNGHGEEGWELVGFVNPPGGRAYAVFKRPMTAKPMPFPQFDEDDSSEFPKFTRVRGATT